MSLRVWGVCVCVFIGHTVSYDAIYAPDFGLVRQLGGMTCIQVFSMRLFVQDPCTLASASIPCPALFGLNQLSPFISPLTYGSFVGSLLKMPSHFLRICTSSNLCIFFIFLSC